MPPTRTIGPLHLEDLEPHRFEDMVRQLIYDFRNWQALEATGRTGSDDGFDARGIESLQTMQSASPSENEEDEEGRVEPVAPTRTWLIQCKREKSIPPKKLVNYLKEIPEESHSASYGIIFAAACDFSKLARDSFRDITREQGYLEAYLWGKAEIEDMLYQPKNDFLLFAYFGISLQARRRSLKADVRARLATKRKALRLLHSWQPVLVRDASDDRYPLLDENKLLHRMDRGRWFVTTHIECRHDGAHFIIGKHFAIVKDDDEWDYAELMNDAVVTDWQNPWLDEDVQRERQDARNAARAVQETFPETNRAILEVHGVLPYDTILDIDEKGDEYLSAPQIYTSEFDRNAGPFPLIVERLDMMVRSDPPRNLSLDPKKRIRLFDQND